MLQIILDSLHEHAARVAFSHGERNLSYADLEAASARFARRLAVRGVAPGDRVAIHLRSGVDYPVACLGVWRAGAVVVPVDAAGPVSDLRHRHEVAGFRFMVSDTAPATDWHGVAVITTTGDEEDGPPQALPGNHHADDFLLLFTSGTTGAPKALVHTRDSLLAGMRRDIRTTGYRGGDTVLATLGFNFALGMTNLLLAPLLAGARVIIHNPFSPRAALALIRKHEVTHLVTVAPVVKLLAAVAQPPALPSLRYVMVGGTTLEPAVRADFAERFGIVPAQSYGMSEIGRIASHPHPLPTDEPGCVGTPQVTVRITDEQGRPLPAGTTGSITVQSDSLCKPRYLLSGGESEPVPIQGGFLDTGDLGHLDPAGSLFVAGRRKQFILGPRFKVDPAEVEEVLLSHPAIRDAVVVPAPGRAGYEAVRAVVVSAGGISRPDVIVHCAVSLPSGKCPEIVTFVDRIPRNAMGKVELGSLPDPR